MLVLSVLGALACLVAPTPSAVGALAPPSGSRAAVPVLPDGGTVPQLRRAGPWSVDGDGRVVLVHGVNAVWKLDPYVPPATPEGFVAADADFLASQGFNTVRIGVLFSGVMPQPGVIDTGYLDAWQRVVDLLAARHIWVMVDFHQDLFTEKFQGEGFPSWAVHQPTTSSLPDPTAGFPANYFTPQVSETFDQLWAGTGDVPSFVAQAWRAVATHFRDQPYLMGYDLINEPWPGADWASCANPVGCPSDTLELEPYLDLSRRAIREVDPANVVWYEPNVLFDFGAGSMLQGPGDDPQLGLSWHDYCLAGATLHAQGFTDLPGCENEEDLVFGNAAALATRLRATQVLSEFGASDDLPDLGLVTGLADRYLVGWQYWHYKLWRDPTTESQTSGAQGLFTDDTDLASLKQAKADLLVRSYPMATAGEPRSLDYDPATGELTYVYAPGPVAGTAARAGRRDRGVREPAALPARVRRGGHRGPGHQPGRRPDRHGRRNPGGEQHDGPPHRRRRPGRRPERRRPRRPRPGRAIHRPRGGRCVRQVARPHRRGGGAPAARPGADRGRAARAAAPSRGRRRSARLGWTHDEPADHGHRDRVRRLGARPAHGERDGRLLAGGERLRPAAQRPRAPAALGLRGGEPAARRPRVRRRRRRHRPR